MRLGTEPLQPRDLLNDRGYSRFSGKARTSDIRSLQKELGDWLAHLPKPVGIFAANDFMAAQVAAAASRVGLDIPGDIALVGVDNDELLCENTNPTLSSVRPDFRAAGEKAAELLADPTRDRTAIANLCGYSSANALANFLRRSR